MLRDLAAARDAVAALSDDLTRWLGQRLTVVLDDGWVLTVTSAGRRWTVQLDQHADPDALPPLDELAGEEVELALQDEASEAVVEDAHLACVELGIPWPACDQHASAPLVVCSQTWVCSSAISHNIGLLGQLPRPDCRVTR